MSDDTHFTVILDAKYYGPFKRLADAERFAMQRESSTVIKTQVFLIWNELCPGNDDYVRWVRDSPPGSERNPIPPAHLDSENAAP